MRSIYELAILVLASFVMNTTPTTPEPRELPYTVIGSQGADANERSLLPFTLLVLHRNNRHERADIFDRIHRLNAREVISVETVNPRWDIEAYSTSYKEFRFLLFSREPDSLGQALNIAINEATSRQVLVIWSDVQVMPISKAYLDEFALSRDLCIIPHIRSLTGEVLPTLHVPAGYRKALKILSLVPGPSQKSSLFPFDFMGLYNRDAFLQTTGFDEHILEPWWQKMDFGFRSWIWGNKMRASPGLRLQVLGEQEPEDTSIGPGYVRFYGKNMLPEFLADHGALSTRRFFAFKKASGASIGRAWQQFQDLRSWVFQHRYRFRTEARSIVEFWDHDQLPHEKVDP